MVALTSIMPNAWNREGNRLRGAHLSALIAASQALLALLLVALAKEHTVAVAAVMVFSLVVMGHKGLLCQPLELSALDEIPRVVSAFAVSAAITASTLLMLNAPSAALATLKFAPFASVASWTLLAVCYAFGRAYRKRGFFGDNAIVLGSGLVADRLERVLVERPQFGLRVVGQASPNPTQDPHSSSRALMDVLAERHARVVIVAYSQATEAQLISPLRTCAARGVKVLIVPRFFEELDRKSVSTGIRGIPLRQLPMPTTGRVRLFLKRALDTVIASIAFVILLPLMAVCAIAIKRETGAAMLFRQIRVGQGERHIELLKFQTMKPATQREGDTMWNIMHDDRLGPVGRFLRKTSLDELPQLWNVIRGDMSLVGPRPERPHFVAQFKDEIPGYSARHRVPVGLTGWAQVHELRGDSSIEERAFFDNIYAASWTPWEDLKILLRTIPEVFRGSGG